MSIATAPAAIRDVRAAGDVPLWIHAGWAERFPWLVQGTTSAGTADEPFDLGLFGTRPVGEILERWEMLRSRTGMRQTVHSLQVHGSELSRHDAAPQTGLLVTRGYDGHLTARPDILLTVSVADCVPVFLVARDSREVGLVHAGWRGTAAGIVERAAAALAGDGGPSQLWAHCGPSICGECYEVGPEVHAGVSPELPVPERPEPIDLRLAIARRLSSAGVEMEQISVSTHCTRCGDGGFFSHRAGSAGRQMGVLGIRELGG